MKLLLLLNKNNLTFFTKNNQPQKLVFPPEAINHQEIIDHKLYEELLTKAFAQIPKQETLLFLARELVYAKSIPLGKETSLEEELKKFASIVPISRLAIEIKTIQTKQAAHLLATNGDLYKTVVTVAEENKCRIKKVAPLVAFGSLPEGQEISYGLLSQLAKDKKALKRGDFLQKDKERKTDQKAPVKQILILMISLLFFAGAIYWAAVTLDLLPKNKPVKEKPKVSAKLTITPSPQPSPTITENSIKKEDVKIQILNGSGVAGQAGKIEDQLAEIGFTNVQTGNAEGPTSNATIVIFSKEIPKDYEDAIVAELKKTFSSIDSQRLPTANVFGVSITTGEVK